MIGFIYRPHVLTHRSGRQVREFGAQAPSNTSQRSAGSRVRCLGPFSGFSCASDRPFVIERQVCSLSTKPQVSTTPHYTITVCVQPYNTQSTLLACQRRGPIIKFQISSGDRGIEPRTLRTSSGGVTTRPPRPPSRMVIAKICFNVITHNTSMALERRQKK